MGVFILGDLYQLEFFKSRDEFSDLFEICSQALVLGGEVAINLVNHKLGIIAGEEPFDLHFFVNLRLARRALYLVTLLVALNTNLKHN